MARSGSVRFRVRFRPVPELNGSVRFGFLVVSVIEFDTCSKSVVVAHNMSERPKQTNNNNSNNDNNNNNIDNNTNTRTQLKKAVAQTNKSH